MHLVGRHCEGCARGFGLHCSLWRWGVAERAPVGKRWDVGGRGDGDSMGEGGDGHFWVDDGYGGGRREAVVLGDVEQDIYGNGKQSVNGFDESTVGIV